MKNLYLLPTDKPSRLHLGKSGLILCDFVFNSTTINPQHIHITVDEKLKERDWFLNIKSGAIGQHNGAEILLFKDDKKIILTTDPKLIADGVQAIDDTFLEWFVKNPNCEKVEIEIKTKWKSIVYDQPDIQDGYIYKIIIPKEASKREPLEEVTERLQNDLGLSFHDGIIDGAKWQAERLYSEEEVKQILMKTDRFLKADLEIWFEQFKKK